MAPGRLSRTSGRSDALFWTDQEVYPTFMLVQSPGLREGVAIQMGMIIGSGIFLVPATTRASRG